LFRREVLPNGIRVITEAVPHVGSASIGFWIGAGSRWERPEEAGISHLLEHMLFKGTERRTARDIAEELDSVGGRLNAFTDKEATCYYAKVLGEHLPIAIDVLSDMILHSVHDPAELEREQNVILEEIKQHEDDPEGLIHDLFSEKLWPDHPLGRPVIGTPETVSAVDRPILTRYLGEWYTPDRIIVAVAGNIRPDEVLDLVSNAFSGLRPRPSAIPITPVQPAAGEHRMHRDIEQVNLCIGSQTPPHQSDDRYPLACLDVAFGGGMSSRLFQEIRENRGLAYSVGSYFTLYNEGGQFNVFAGTSMETMDEVLEVIRVESEKVCAEGLTPEELQRAKNQIKGSMLMDLESMSSRMSRLGKTELYFGRVITEDEVVREIDAVTLEQVQGVAQRVLGVPLTMAAIGPFEGDGDSPE
jgi:predicted Zn-dependent peptidase